MTTEVILVKAGQLLLSLSILVVLHELGHFIPAKLFKTRVEKFYLFFDPWFSLFKIKKGETEYGVGWLPLGGYVKISGMIDESMDKEQMAKPPQPWEFRAKPAWQRLIIMIGGVTVNIILAFFIYAMMLWYWGEKYLPADAVKYGVTVDSLGKSIGIHDGDRIVAVNNRKVEQFDAIPGEVILEEAKSIQVIRDGQTVSLPVPDGFIRQLLKQKVPFAFVRFPYYADNFEKGSVAETSNSFKKGDQIISLNGELLPYFTDFAKEIRKHKNENVIVGVVRGTDTLNIAVKLPESGKLGIYYQNPEKFFEYKTRKYTFMEAIPAGFSKSIDKLVKYVQQLRLIFVSKEVKVSESLGGFMSIGNLFPEQWDWMMFWEMTAFLSIILAFMNILPIPALDGGHVLFLLYEIITGRKPSEKFLEYAQIVGMVLLFGLLIFANGLDFWRNIISKWF
ncbi:RIP metalloprotease RseP [Chitinophaga nivalis]|uniref:Zinc metalloprotease n=1 Tax=Chitinophaga nivalis TaxID=2991709 RepID=A0ABT3IRG0_9BACT|nr:RIP metalloprotease RseP [Chitinophaga nivalis]MCW3463772.1 RIP metalloprotease RseP [Chitinophaga nivalis]MCW3486538.1 RIP metalloprotease RseP [Chitinophaga nivalis]